MRTAWGEVLWPIIKVQPGMDSHHGGWDGGSTVRESVKALSPFHIFTGSALSYSSSCMSSFNLAWIPTISHFHSQNCLWSFIQNLAWIPTTVGAQLWGDPPKLSQIPNYLCRLPPLPRLINYLLLKKYIFEHTWKGEMPASCCKKRRKNARFLNYDDFFSYFVLFWTATYC